MLVNARTIEAMAPPAPPRRPGSAGFRTINTRSHLGSRTVSNAVSVPPRGRESKRSTPELLYGAFCEAGAARGKAGARTIEAMATAQPERPAG